MKMFKKSTMSLALTAAMIGGVAVTQQASANLDVSPGVTAAGDPYVSNNRLGQALIFPYYTTRGDKKTIINIFNTSNRTVAAKVRFHESHNSRDVLDFVVVLSPFDKWAGTVEEGGTGPIFKSRDNTCTVPAIPSQGVALESGAYSGGFADSGEQTVDRLREGYVEVISMGYADEDQQGWSGTTVASSSGAAPTAGGNTGNVAYNSKHVAGVPRDCSKVVAAFNAGSGNNTTGGQGAPSSGTGAFIPALNANQLNLSTTPGGNGSPMAASEFDGMVRGQNPLRGALTIISETNGVGFGTAATAIGDFVDASDPQGDMTGVANPGAGLSANGGTNTANLITAQNLPYFLEPTMASRDGIWATDGLIDVEKAIGATTIINEWANNVTNGAATDWVVQFPTKAFHVDVPFASGTVGCSTGNIQAAVNKWRGNGLVNSAVNIAGCNNTVIPFENRFSGAQGSPVTIASTIYDKEERSTSGGVRFSPQPFTVPTIPWESNIITFSGNGGTSVLSSTSPEVAFDPVATLPGSGTNGMAMVSFPVAQAGSPGLPAVGTVPGYPTTAQITTARLAAGGFQLPVVGFVAKERNQGSSALSFGQIMDHSYR